MAEQLPVLAVLAHDRLVGLANRFLTGSTGESSTTAAAAAAGIASSGSAAATAAAGPSSASSAASAVPTLPTPDYITAAFYSFLALARFPESVPARRILAACILAGADPFPFGPSSSAGGPPVVSAAPGLLAGGISSAAAHAALQLLQCGPKTVFEDVGCATLFAQASSALSAFSEAHDALSWTVAHAVNNNNNNNSSSSSSMAHGPSAGFPQADIKGKGVDLTGLGILHGMQGASHFRSAQDSTTALLASLHAPAATASAGPAFGPSPSSSSAAPSSSQHQQQHPPPPPPLRILTTTKKIEPSAAQRSQTLLTLGHLAAKGNRLVEAASAFEAALDADRWNWAAWAGLCDVGRVGGRRGVTDGGMPSDTLNRWPQHELGLHGMEEFLPDDMAERVGLLERLVAQEAEAEARWRQLGGGGAGASAAVTAAAATGALSQAHSQPQSAVMQPGISTQGQSQSQSQSQNQGKGVASANGASQSTRVRSGSAATAGTATSTSTYARAGSRTTTGARTAAGNPGSNKRLRSGATAATADASGAAASGARGGGGSAAARSGTAGASGHRANGGMAASRSTSASTARSRTNAGPAAARIHHAAGLATGAQTTADLDSAPSTVTIGTGPLGAGASTQQQDDDDDGDGDDEPMLVDEMPAPTMTMTSSAAEGTAALMEGRQNLPVMEPAHLGVVRGEFEKGPLPVRRSTRTNAQGGAGGGGGGMQGGVAAAARSRVGAATTGTAAGARRAGVGAGAGAAGPTAARTGAGAGRAGGATSAASNRSQTGSAAAQRGVAGGGANTSTASRATTVTSSVRSGGFGTRAPKSSSSTDSSYGGGGMLSTTGNVPGRAGPVAGTSRTKRNAAGGGGGGAANGSASTSNAAAAAAAALSAAAAEVQVVRERREAVEKEIEDAKAAAQQVASRWSHVDMDVVGLVRQLAEAYRTVRLYQGRQTAFLLRGIDEVARARSGTAASTEEQQAELALNEKTYGATPFVLGLPDAILNTDPVRALLGRAAHDSAKYAEAEMHFDSMRRGASQPQMFRASASVPTRHMDIYSLVLFHLNREVKLSALAQELGMLDANAAETHIASGNAFALQREHAQAMRAFKRAALIAPGCAYAYTLAGYEAIELAQLERAVGFFRSAIRVDMRHWNAWAGLGQIFLKIGKMDWAEAHYREALAINPHHAVLKDLLGWTYESQGRWNEALLEYNAALAMSPKLAMTRLKRAELLTQLESYEEAHEELLRVASLVPDESRVHILLAKSYMRLGNGHFADPNVGSGGGGHGPDKSSSSSMANQPEPMPPNRYHEAISFHLAAAIDLDPKNVRIVKAMGEGARVALKGTRRHIDASAMDSTLDSSMYVTEPSGDVLEDGPEESGLTHAVGSDHAMEDSGDEENEGHGGQAHEDDEIDDDDDDDDESEGNVSSDGNGEDSDDEASAASASSSASGSSPEDDDDDDDHTDDEEDDEGDAENRGPGGRGGPGRNSLDAQEESENIEPPRQLAGDQSENSYPATVARGVRQANNSNLPTQQAGMAASGPTTAMRPPTSTPNPGAIAVAANLSLAASSIGRSSISGDGSVAMSEEQSMELDSSL